MIYLFVIFFFIIIAGISAYFINKKYQQDKDNKQQEEQNIATSNLKSSLLAGSRIAKSNLNSSLEADSRVAESNLTASNVTNSLEAGSLLAASNVTGSLLAASTLPSSLLAASTLPSSLLAASTLPSSLLAASTVSASNLDASNLAASTVTASTVTASTVTASNLAASNLAASNLAASNLAASTVTGSTLAASTLANPIYYVETVLGTGTGYPSYIGGDVPTASVYINTTAKTTNINHPSGLLFDNENNMYVGCKIYGALYKVSPNGTIIMLTRVPNTIFYMCWNKTSNYNIIYMTAYNKKIYKYNILNRELTEFIDLEPDSTSIHSENASGIDCDSSGNLYISSIMVDISNTILPTPIYKYNTTQLPLSRQIITPPSTITLDKAYSIYIDSTNNVYFSQPNSIVMLSSSGIWSTIYSTTNTFYEIRAITKSSTGQIYVQYNYKDTSSTGTCNIGIIESQNTNTIKYISGLNTTNTTNLGTQTYLANDITQENQLATQASFGTPTMIALDSNNNIYVADRYNNRVRKIYKQ